ncbi:MAG: flagellar export chaperone FliS [Gemmatimonadetes bacterium SCN 70-22]|nr:MAG: flagellar export chaperone FliS [Gemmatimonadetes bacterium SCN 70-22]
MYGTTTASGRHGGGCRGATAPANRYLELEVLSATPQQLVVIVYDHLLACLKRARLAIERGEVETRTAQLGRAKDAIAELVATLDRERGGEIARRLSGLYAFFLNELTDVGMHPDANRLSRVLDLVAELRDAWALAAEGAV